MSNSTDRTKLQTPRRFMSASSWPLTRDILLFVAGLGGVGHETIVSKAERPTLLILFAAMMGLPAFLRPQEEPKPTGGGNE